MHNPVHPTYIPQDPLSSEPITISSQATNQPPVSPLLKVEDCTDNVFDRDPSAWEAKDGSYTINQLSQSPKRVGFYRNRDSRSTSLSVSPPCISPSASDDDLRTHHNCPSSPLLVAMRDAVDSLNKYEDFKIIEKIGAGFFADVYKVSRLSNVSLCKVSVCMLCVKLGYLNFKGTISFEVTVGVCIVSRSCSEQIS